MGAQSISPIARSKRHLVRGLDPDPRELGDGGAPYAHRDFSLVHCVGGSR